MENDNKQGKSKDSPAPSVFVKVSPDEFTRKAVDNLRSNFDRTIRNDMNMLKKHGFYNDDT